MTEHRAMSTRPRRRAAAAVSRCRRTAPPPTRLWQAVPRIVSRPCSVSGLAWRWWEPTRRARPPRDLLTSSLAVGSGRPAARWAAPVRCIPLRKQDNYGRGRRGGV